ncbi:hypothetical protein D3C72_1606760 [compost metagenome]
MDGNHRDCQRRRIGQHMHRIRDQRQAARQNAADDLGEHEAARKPERSPEARDRRVADIRMLMIAAHEGIRWLGQGAGFTQTLLSWKAAPP